METNNGAESGNETAAWQLGKQIETFWQRQTSRAAVQQAARHLCSGTPSPTKKIGRHSRAWAMCAGAVRGGRRVGIRRGGSPTQQRASAEQQPLWAQRAWPGRQAARIKKATALCVEEDIWILREQSLREKNSAFGERAFVCCEMFCRSNKKQRGRTRMKTERSVSPLTCTGRTLRHSHTPTARLLSLVCGRPPPRACGLPPRGEAGRADAGRLPGLGEE